MEYFGLSERADEVGDRYRERMQKKIKFYETLTDYGFIDIYPSDIRKKIEEITNLKLGSC